MKLIEVLLLAAAVDFHSGFERLPGSAIGPINCPPPPATIRTMEGRIYECRPEEGQDPYVDVTPPDDKAHWKLPFGSPMPPPYGTGSYHPVEDWPFRAIISRGNPAAHNVEYYYVFDRHGVVVDSNAPGATGDRMTEVRVSGVRLWPTAKIYYRMRLPNAGEAMEPRGSIERVAAAANFALILDRGRLCPVLDESYISEWPIADESTYPAGKYINGHCGDAYRIPSHFSENDPRHPRYYTYPGFNAGGLDLLWSFQRHDEPERPVLDRKGECVALCKHLPDPTAQPAQPR